MLDNSLVNDEVIKGIIDDSAILDRGAQDCVVKRSSSENRAEEHRRKYNNSLILLTL